MIRLKDPNQKTNETDLSTFTTILKILYSHETDMNMHNL